MKDDFIKVIALGHCIATAQGYSTITLLNSDCKDCLILLIYFKFERKHKHSSKNPEYLERFPVCDHRKGVLNQAPSLCTFQLPSEVLHSSMEVTAL